MSNEVEEASPHSLVSLCSQLAKLSLQRQVFSEILFRLVQADPLVFLGLNCSGGYPAVLLQIEVIDFRYSFLQLLHSGALAGGFG